MPTETPTLAWAELLPRLSPKSLAWLRSHAGETIYYYRRDLGWVRTTVPTGSQI